MTGLQLQHLDECTRRFMLNELEQDVARGGLYLSPRLSDVGRVEYESLLRAALENGTEQSFADELRSHGRMRLAMHWERPDAPPIVGELPRTAPDTLAESEFHRFYARGLCRRALDLGIHALEIYRARPTEQNRNRSEALVGVRIDATSLLEDLRGHPGREPGRVLPSCPDSGLSVRLP